ncbi:MAG: metalloregulator ArsR/SmtB family transcription factor [Patescibacteria group bacterium]|jgi:ArsR family transcriptional regulator
MALRTKILARVFKVIGNERRMGIIKLLSQKESSVIDISSKINLSFKSVSKHLQRLEHEGVVEKEQRGKFMFYRLSKEFKNAGVLKQIINSK